MTLVFGLWLAVWVRGLRLAAHGKNAACRLAADFFSAQQGRLALHGADSGCRSGTDQQGDPMTTNDTAASAVAEFMTAINMSSDTLRAWLNTAESKALDQPAAMAVAQVEPDAGDAREARAAAGAGLRTIALLRKSRHEYTDADVAHARDAVGFIRRWMALRPAGDVAHTPWRYALMNWGYDPTRS
jgi:hypothetical protein